MPIFFFYPSEDDAEGPIWRKRCWRLGDSLNNYLILLRPFSNSQIVFPQKCFLTPPPPADAINFCASTTLAATFVGGRRKGLRIMFVLYDCQTGGGADVWQRHAGHDQEEGGGVCPAPGDSLVFVMALRYRFLGQSSVNVSLIFVISSCSFSSSVNIGRLST